jgi:hypothetical protein
VRAKQKPTALCFWRWVCPVLNFWISSAGDLRQKTL